MIHFNTITKCLDGVTSAHSKRLKISNLFYFSFSLFSLAVCLQEMAYGLIIGSGSVVASFVINIAVLPMLVPKCVFRCVNPVESVCFWRSEYRIAMCGQLSIELKCSFTRNMSGAISWIWRNLCFIKWFDLHAKVK